MADGEVHFGVFLGFDFARVRDLPPLPEGHVYEVWLIGGDEPPVPAGTFDQSTDQHAIACRAPSRTVVVTNLRRLTPARPARRIRRATRFLRAATRSPARRTTPPAPGGR